jgi:hypothetical protein
MGFKKDIWVKIIMLFIVALVLNKGVIGVVLRLFYYIYAGKFRKFCKNYIFNLGGRFCSLVLLCCTGNYIYKVCYITRVSFFIKYYESDRMVICLKEVNADEESKEDWKSVVLSLGLGILVGLRVWHLVLKNGEFGADARQPALPGGVVELDLTKKHILQETVDGIFKNRLTSEKAEAGKLGLEFKIEQFHRIDKDYLIAQLNALDHNYKLLSEGAN